jgi:hypothetical protein
MPPKLLEVPNAGLTQFLAPAFNTRLSREQPLNIEADAELGMPLNLVGMPGVFDGNQLGKASNFVILGCTFGEPLSDINRSPC